MNTLIVVFRAAGPSPVARPMARTLWDFAWILRNYKDNSRVRKLALLAMLLVFEQPVSAMALQQDFADVVNPVIEWLNGLL